MKLILKLEELALLLLFAFVYFEYCSGSWLFFVALFFVPDLSIFFYLINKKMGAIMYNIFHHKGVMFLIIALGYIADNELLVKVGLIFMSHSCFDRIAGYGLKYLDSFDHTHLGWIGKSKHKNIITTE
jgi:hypothetical protein